MAFDELPPDPYILLGVAKDAKLPEIRSAHRKLVLKCHPDKVQDAALKAIKQDEFQKVQQAYELLSDDNRRLQYDEQVKLHALRKEMGRGNPTPRSNPFEYEVKNAEPRATTYTTYTQPPPRPMPRETTKVYPQQQRPSSYEDVAYEPVRHPKKSASYESADRDRKPRARDEDRTRDARRQEEDERVRAKFEKESKRTAYGEKKKRSDKERRRGAEEKQNSRAAYVEDDSDDDYRAAAQAKDRARRERHRMEDEIRMRNEEDEAAKEAAQKAEALLSPKWDDHKKYAAQYMQAARRKGAPAAEEFHPRPPQRAETFAPGTKYRVRYEGPPPAVPVYPPSDDELPRRSSAGRISRRASETPTSRGKDTPKSSSKDKEREKDRKRSGRSRSKDPYIVEPPSPSLKQMPTLQSHSSAPPIVPVFPSRKEPSRSKTQDYPRNKDGAAVPPLPRAATFQSGDQANDRGGSRGSRLRKTVDYASDSESDSPTFYPSNRHSHSPPPPRRREAPEPTRYIIYNGRTVPITSRGGHRSEMRGIDNDVPYVQRDRDRECDRERERSESPLSTTHHPRASERPPVSGATRQGPVRSPSQSYYPPPPPPPPEAPEPVIRDARPKMSPRESRGHDRSRTRGSGGAPASGGPFFGEVKYASPYRPEDVIYNETLRRGSDPTHHAHAAREYGYASPPLRGERVYAA